MLPGVAGICMFMIFMTMLNAYAGLHGSFGDGFANDGETSAEHGFREDRLENCHLLRRAAINERTQSTT